MTRADIAGPNAYLNKFLKIICIYKSLSRYFDIKKRLTNIPDYGLIVEELCLMTKEKRCLLLLK
jgi:hypothetical protein